MPWYWILLRDDVDGCLTYSTPQCRGSHWHPPCRIIGWVELGCHPQHCRIHIATQQPWQCTACHAVQIAC
eukprot:6491107-Amphidinium_carterae.2